MAMVVTVLVQALAYFGVVVGSEELTTTITTLVTVVSGLVVMYRQYSTGRSTLGGLRPK
jgi:hypothetical protein